MWKGPLFSQQTVELRGCRGTLLERGNAVAVYVLEAGVVDGDVAEV